MQLHDSKLQNMEMNIPVVMDSMGGIQLDPLQWGTKVLEQLTRCVFLSPLSPAPKQCCSLCSPVHFSLS